MPPGSQWLADLWMAIQDTWELNLLPESES
jgi:hypothetical protein